MKDGAIIQIGTPEELVLDPATEYVAEFTRDIPRAKVLSARAVMGAPVGPLPAERVSLDTKIEDLAERLFDNGEEAVAVTDERGEVVGVVGRQAVLDLLVRKHGAA